MKKLLAISLLTLLNAPVQAFENKSTGTSYKIGTLCGDCGGPCDKEKPEAV